MDALYIHIPFCDKKCFYCDFWTFINMGHEIGRYTDYLIKESRLYPVYYYDTVYFGGGTPGLIGAGNFAKILSALKIRENAEITVEINPLNYSAEDFREYIKTGINRLSIGIQSFQDHVLKTAGRNHNSSQALETYQKAREAGFDNITIDLMFGIPGQTIEDVRKDIEIIKEIKPDHISVYSLIWEEGTLFWKQREKGTISEIDIDLEAYMYETIIEELTSEGYVHYEISNFAKPGKKARHNTKYWENREFIGLGVNSSSYFNNQRYKNHKNLYKYYRMIDNGEIPADIQSIENINEIEKEQMRIILGLRLLDTGISYFSDNRVEKLIKEGFLEKKEDRIRLTKKGIMLANDVFVEFI
jgi:oxygen-independent coproporphyrinogen-3 oxidase